MKLYPIPGHTFLHVLVPAEEPSTRNDDPVPTTPVAQEPTRSSAAPLVKVALDATFGIRQIQALQRTRFSRTVLNHVARQRRRISKQGPVNLESFHVRADGEIFGTAVSSGRRYGYAARIDHGRLTSFRVL